MAAFSTVSTGGPGGKGGTACSAETRRSSLVCSGTERIPARCFGNSGENRSARRRKQEKGVTGKRRDADHNGREQGAVFIRGAWCRPLAADS